MAADVFIEHVIRQTTLEGELLHYIVRTHRRPWVKVLAAEAVPPFDGKSAWFEVEKPPKKPWRFLRRLTDEEVASRGGRVDPRDRDRSRETPDGG